MFLKTIHRSTSLLVFVMATALLFSCNQDKSNRKSPPAQVSGKIGEATIRVDYSQPSVRERKIWDELVPYGKVWRTGANEATVFEVDQDIQVEGEVLPKGKYALFTIPGKDTWKIIFNKNFDQWGAFKYKPEENQLEVSAEPLEVNDSQERMTFTLDTEQAVLTLAWEKIQVPINLQ